MVFLPTLIHNTYSIHTAGENTQALPPAHTHTSQHAAPLINTPLVNG